MVPTLILEVSYYFESSGADGATFCTPDGRQVIISEWSEKYIIYSLNPWESLQGGAYTVGKFAVCQFSALTVNVLSSCKSGFAIGSCQGVLPSFVVTSLRLLQFYKCWSSTCWTRCFHPANVHPSTVICLHGNGLFMYRLPTLRYNLHVFLPSTRQNTGVNTHRAEQPSVPITVENGCEIILVGCFLFGFRNTKFWILLRPSSPFYFSPVNTRESSLVI